MIRPQNLQRKQHESLLQNLKKGDKIVTRGGITGIIVDITGKNKEKLIIKVGNSSNITILKSYIVSLDK